MLFGAQSKSIFEQYPPPQEESAQDIYDSQSTMDDIAGVKSKSLYEKTVGSLADTAANWWNSIF